jgi:hypothetical protein
VANSRDAVLLETVRTHRARLLAAFLFGELAERRVVNENIKRLLGSVVLAAVACAGCVGFALVTSLLASQAAQKAAQARQTGGGTTPGISDQPFAADHFDRARRSGWGTAEVGGSWRLTGRTSIFTVQGGAGVITVGGSGNPVASLPQTLRETSDTTVRVKMPGSGTTVRILGRQVAGNDYRVLVSRTGVDQLSISLASRRGGKIVPLSNTMTLLAPFLAADVIKIRFQVYGTNPTIMRVRVWRDGGQESTGWHLAAGDSFPGLQRTGFVGIGAGSEQDAAEVDVLDFVSRPVLG